MPSSILFPPHSFFHQSTLLNAAMPPPPRLWWFVLIFFFLHFSLRSALPECGGVQIPFPFYLNTTSSSSSNASLSDAFSLYCFNSSILLTIDYQTYRILHFFDDGVLVDFPNASLCRRYNDLRSFAFSGNQYFGISADNLLDLYDCEDSSLCKPDCEKTSLMPDCGGGAATYPSCCYPLSDHCYWRPGDSLTGFSKFGCRGFSSWVVFSGSRIGKRGIKLEWAVPRNSTRAKCAPNANAVYATSVASGIRCRCIDGFSGDGFSAGDGCFKSCLKDAHRSNCYQSKHGRKKALILAGVLTSTISVVSLTAIFLLRRSIRSEKFISGEAHSRSSISEKPYRPRLFKYHELDEATKGFSDSQKIVGGGGTSTLYAGVLIGGTRIAVQKIQSETDQIQLLFQLETLSAISHRNIARIIGWCIDAGRTPLAVYDYPGNGTFWHHLRRARDDIESLDWYKRLNIAAETACLLAFLHHEISPPISHHDLHSGCIFLDSTFSVKLAGFELLNSSNDRRTNDVYSLGLILLEAITGEAAANCSSAVILQKIKKGKLEEMVDPSLYYHEQTPFHQIEIVADLATRCLLFGGDGKLGMMDVARELVHISVDGNSRGTALEETFSNSSLLQMISMSPDSIHLP